MKKTKNTLVTALLAVSVAAGLSGCSKDNNSIQAPVVVKTYVIVPGAWSAPYAWQTVKGELEAQGQKVYVVLLPGHGGDKTAFATLTLDKYRDRVVQVIDSLNTNVILVGHSLGGMVISEVAEAIPSKIEKMVYVAAYLPQNGQSLLTLASTDTTSLLGQSIIPVNGGLSLDLPQDKIIDIFIQDGSSDVKALVLKNYLVEPGIPFGNPAVLTTAKFGSVDKYYIHTLQDHAVTLKLQNRMVVAAGLTKIYNINTSHSPFLAKPDSLTILLRSIAVK